MPLLDIYLIAGIGGIIIVAAAALIVLILYTAKTIVHYMLLRCLRKLPIAEAISELEDSFK